MDDNFVAVEAISGACDDVHGDAVLLFGFAQGADLDRCGEGELTLIIDGEPGDVGSGQGPGDGGVAVGVGGVEVMDVLFGFGDGVDFLGFGDDG